MTGMTALADSIRRFGGSTYELMNALIRMAAVSKPYKSNNWLKMHGRPMRRKIK